MLPKKQYAKVIAAFLLLFTFATGQLIVIAHTHNRADYGSHQNKKDNTDDKCRICDHHSHVQLFYQHHQTLFTVAVTRINTYGDYSYTYTGISLFHLCSRGPPAVTA